MPNLTPTWRLALSYLAIIMTMSIIFSFVVFAIISSQLDRPLPPFTGGMSGSSRRELPADARARVEQRDNETRLSVAVSLASLNVVILLGGSALSYFLARRTLEPIERALDAQTQFVSDASHELRTPLTALMTANEVALRKKELDDSKMRQVLTKNIVEIEKLKQLSEALLGLSKTDKLESKQKLKLTDLTSEIIAELEPLASKKSINLAVDAENKTVTVNKAICRQILTCFIENSVKYSPSNSTIEIKAALRASQAVIQVSDKGIGMSEADQAHAFERFYRGDNARTRTDSSGYGLGLAIAYASAQRAGYKLGVKSKIGHGSTFELTIPQ